MVKSPRGIGSRGIVGTVATMVMLLHGADARAQSMPAPTGDPASLSWSPLFELPPPTAERPLNEVRKHRSVPMMITGIVLTGLSGAAGVLGGSVAVASALSPSPSGGNLAGVAIGGLALAAGGLLSGVGVPLWVYGASSPPDSERPAGAGSVATRQFTLSWTF